jgi:FtsP/CotA-like multicopper oxidase with cupredoxin domain
MAGAIVVDGIEDVLPSLAGLRERVIVVRQVFLYPDRAETVTLNARLCGLAHLTPKGRINFLRAHPELIHEDDEKLNTVVTLNGQTAGSINIGIAPGERQLFRVINATPKRNLDLAVDGERLELVAEDGVPLGYLPGSVPSKLVSDIVIPPGGRAEFVVTGSSQPTVMRSLAFDSGPKGDPDPPFELATLVDDTGLPAASSDARLPMPEAHLEAKLDYYRSPPSAPVVRRIARLEESDDGKRFFINRKAFDPHDAPMFVAKSGTVEEWVLENETQEVHTFHTHQVHFIVESIGDQVVRPEQRHWLDTFDVPYKRGNVPGRVKILVDFRDPVVRGTFVFHCHILDHEDNGMMAKIRVV